MKSLKGAFEDAEKRAKMRDMHDREQKEKNAVNLGIVNEEGEKAETQGYTIVKKKDVNQAAFTQIISENYRYLQKKQYLTNAEKVLIMDLAPHVEYGSGVILLQRGQIPKIPELAQEIGRKERSFRGVLNQVIKKGIIYELVDTQMLKQYGRTLEERMLIFNPEIIVAANKNYINLTLCHIHWASDRLEKAKVKLPWKVWYALGMEYGRLYKRSTWLAKKKKYEERLSKKNKPK